uniref:Uncharacterized protein n=1 Tax=Astyanax mexicanus TaxID=7994 RepID=A0A8B9GYD7_ASTMX
MDPSTTILRVKRKRGTDPADALLLACKRIRPEPNSAQPAAAEPGPEPATTAAEPRIENSVFKLVATVSSQVPATDKPAGYLATALANVTLILMEFIRLA